jgi:hypothetical protein
MSQSEPPDLSILDSLSMKCSTTSRDEEVAYVISGKSQRPLPPLNGGKGHRGRYGGRFIRGPIPLAWMQKASTLPKCGLVVAVAVAYCRGLEKKNEFRLRPARLRDFCIGRSTAARGIEALEKSGLISVLHRHQGRAPLIEVREWDPSFDISSENTHTS